jgi:hypothetical protein
VRRSERMAVNEPVRLHPNSWSSLEVRVLDCSESGFRAHCEAKVTVGLFVTLDVPGIGPVRATVSWRRGHQFGARFEQPIDLDRAEFRPIGSEAVLARLLVQRAAAQESGLADQEVALRRRILTALPLHKTISR